MSLSEQKPVSYAMRAAVCSACIFPGAGLFMLRQHLRGCIFAVPAAVILLLLFKDLFAAAFRINDRLKEQAELGNFSFDFIALFHELHGSLFASPYWQDGKWILLASWLLSIASSYFVGKKFDLQTSPETR